jgi:HPt (histidine-containing phosphotransfer) domain-containing protein
MNKSLSDNTFNFSEPFDSQYIFELYAGDYIMIGETFADVLNEYDEFVETINSSFQAENVPALKSAVHKIKPLFGFVGLLSLQAQCQDFENACQQADLPGLRPSFNLLKDKLIQARSLIRAEQARLEQFNNA